MRTQVIIIVNNSDRPINCEDEGTLEWDIHELKYEPPYLQEGICEPASKERWYHDCRRQVYKPLYTEAPRTIRTQIVTKKRPFRRSHRQHQLRK